MVTVHDTLLMPEAGLQSLTIVLDSSLLNQSIEELELTQPIAPASSETEVSGTLIGKDTQTTVKDASGLLQGELSVENGLYRIKLRPSNQIVGYYEGLAAMLSVTSQPFDLIAGSTMRTSLAAIEMNSMAPIGALQADTYRVKTGSSVDVQSLSALVGVGNKVPLGSAVGNFALFAEFGHASFDTKSTFDSSGNAMYYGAGALARVTGPTGAYVEGSVRVGWLDGEFDGVASTGGYEQQGLYWGAHLGAGWIAHLSDRAAGEMFGQVFYTRQNFDDMKLRQFSLAADSATSLRTRLGLRYRYSVDNWATGLMVGWDHEFDGETGGQALGARLDAPSLSGSSAVIEGNFALMPETSGLSLSGRLGGYLGNRSGLYTSLSMLYRF